MCFRYRLRVLTGLLCLTAVHRVAFSAPQDARRSGGAAEPRTIALTFDDLPMTVVGDDHVAGPLAETQAINRSMLRALRAHQATALGLVNEVKLNVPGERDARAALLEDWLDAGMLLGNHGYSHRDFRKVTSEEYEAEFLRGDVITVPMLVAHHQTERYFRPPYLDSGDTVEKKERFDRSLVAHGYQVAPFTIQNEDWMFNASYDEAVRKHDSAEMQRVRTAYLAHVSREFDYAEALTQSSFGRSIAQILFMHTDLLNADALDDVLTLVERRGYRFVSLPEAMRDPAYQTKDAFVGATGASWLERWQPSLGRMTEMREPEPPAWIQDNYKRIVP